MAVGVTDYNESFKINNEIDNSFFYHVPSSVTVVFSQARIFGGGYTITGLTQEDDSVQVEQTTATVTYTQGLYGRTTANVALDTRGLVTLKIIANHNDNFKLLSWHEQLTLGKIMPANITLGAVGYRKTAYRCLPTQQPTVLSASREEPSVTWTFVAQRIVTKGYPVSFGALSA